MEDGSVAYQLYVGVDIAAETFVAAWLAPGGKPTTPFAGEQTPAGAAALQCQLQATGSPATATLVVLEATGNYWVALAVPLHEAGYRVAVVNPRQAHHVAKAPLRRAKTDALDARDLAQLAQALRPPPRPRRRRPTTRYGSASWRATGSWRCGPRRATNPTPCCSGRWSSPPYASILTS